MRVWEREREREGENGQAKDGRHKAEKIVPYACDIRFVVSIQYYR